MFDIGFAELLLVGVIGLLVLGPERLPTAIRTGRFWLAKLRRNFNALRAEFEREFDTEELKREIHNDAVLQGLKETGRDLKRSLDTPYDIDDIRSADAAPTPASPDHEQR